MHKPENPFARESTTGENASFSCILNWRKMDREECEHKAERKRLWIVIRLIIHALKHLGTEITKYLLL